MLYSAALRKRKQAAARSFCSGCTELILALCVCHMPCPVPYVLALCASAKMIPRLGTRFVVVALAVAVCALRSPALQWGVTQILVSLCPQALDSALNVLSQLESNAWATWEETMPEAAIAPLEIPVYDPVTNPYPDLSRHSLPVGCSRPVSWGTLQAWRRGRQNSSAPRRTV